VPVVWPLPWLAPWAPVDPLWPLCWPLAPDWVWLLPCVWVVLDPEVGLLVPLTLEFAAPLFAAPLVDVAVPFVVVGAENELLDVPPARMAELELAPVTPPSA
jgi:hypothetical protein